MNDNVEKKKFDSDHSSEEIDEKEEDRVNAILKSTTPTAISSRVFKEKTNIKKRPLTYNKFFRRNLKKHQRNALTSDRTI